MTKLSGNGLNPLPGRSATYDVFLRPGLRDTLNCLIDDLGGQSGHAPALRKTFLGAGVKTPFIPTQHSYWYDLKT